MTNGGEERSWKDEIIYTSIIRLQVGRSLQPSVKAFRTNLCSPWHCRRRRTTTSQGSLHEWWLRRMFNRHLSATCSLHWPQGVFFYCAKEEIEFNYHTKRLQSISKIISFNYYLLILSLFLNTPCPPLISFQHKLYLRPRQFIAMTCLIIIMTISLNKKHSRLTRRHVIAILICLLRVNFWGRIDVMSLSPWPWWPLCRSLTKN